MSSFADWIDAIRFRWRLVALVACFMTLLAGVYLIITPRLYQATASLLLDTRGPNPLQEGAKDSGQDSRGMIATQVDLIRSPSVTDLAASTTGIDRDPAYRAGWRAATGGRTPFQDWLRGVMQAGLTIVPGKDSNIVTIDVRGRNPIEAARIGNGFARAAVESQYRLRTGPAKTYADWLARRMVGAKSDVIQAQKSLSDFVRATGITNDGDAGPEGAQMAQVETQLAAAEARAAAARQSDYAAPQSRGDAEKSSTVQSLRAQVAQLSSKVSNLRATFGPDYPEVKSAQAELGTLQSSLTRELANSVGAFGAARSAQSASERAAAGASESRLRSLASQQRSRVAGMATNGAEYQRLKNEFGVAQKNYNELNDRLERMRLQGSVPQTEVQVLDYASVPLWPDYPRPGLTVTIALLLGLALGALAAILLEAMNPRVRSWAGIERMLGAPVIGTLSLPPGSSMLLLKGGTASATA